MKKETDATPIYVARDLHAKLKSLAAFKRKKLRELCEARLWPLVKNVNGTGSAK